MSPSFDWFNCLSFDLCVIVVVEVVMVEFVLIARSASSISGESQECLGK